jgi:hypothetical protein
VSQGLGFNRGLHTVHGASLAFARSTEKACVWVLRELKPLERQCDASVTVTRLPHCSMSRLPIRMLENLALAIVVWRQKVNLPPTRNQLWDSRRSWERREPRELMVLASDSGIHLRALANHHPHRTRSCACVVRQERPPCAIDKSNPTGSATRAPGYLHRGFLRGRQISWSVDAHPVRPLPPRHLST